MKQSACAIRLRAKNKCRVRNAKTYRDMYVFLRVMSVLLVAACLGCATDLNRYAASFTPVAEALDPSAVRVREAVTVTPSTGYSEDIRAGSVWLHIGATAQGEVYRPVGDVFTVEGANRHEAYLVVAHDEIVGFYLPGERAFAPLPDGVPLSFY